MDIIWRDESGNILSANKERILYYDASKGEKTKILREEIKAIEIVDGLMNIYEDFNNSLILSVVFPREERRQAIKIFNEFDRTGKTLKGGTGTFLLDLVLESSIILGNPFLGGVLIIAITAIILSLILWMIEIAFGSIGLLVGRLFIILYLAYTLISFILTRIKRKKLKEN